MDKDNNYDNKNLDQDVYNDVRDELVHLWWVHGVVSS